MMRYRNIIGGDLLRFGALLQGLVGSALSMELVLAIASPSAEGQLWRAMEQPELKQALEQAPVLQTESLGEPALGVNVWEHWMVPNLDGKSWDVLQIYFKEYYGPTWLFAVDLGTGQVKQQRLADGHQFYLSGRALGFDGKYYIATPSRQTGSMDLFIYNPATNTLEERGEIVHGLGGEVRPLVAGPDGRIYGTGTRDNRLGLYIYDPRLAKVVKDFGPIGPTHPNGAWSRYVMGVDDTHAYLASGMIPAWYLVTVNLETGEEKVLLESAPERVMDIIEQFPGAYARIPQGSGAPFKEYWLYHGEALLKTNDIPPWSKKASRWEKAVPKPEVYFDQVDPDAGGNAVLWYRPRQEERKALDWKSIQLKGIPTYPHRINPLSPLLDGRLYGTGDDYAGTFIFDPKNDQTTYCGPRTGLAPYTTIVCGAKLYSSGYPGGPLFVYDPAEPWNLGKGGPPGQPVLSIDNAGSNPHRIGEFDRATRVAIMHSSALGADGKIYFGGYGERSYTGGGLGWFDPNTGSLDGFWRPLSGYAVQWLAPALGGRLIVISTIRAADELNDNRAPQEAKLFVYDVNQQRIVREIAPVAKAKTTGLILEVAPGRLLALTSNPQRLDRSVLYGVDLANGEVVFTKDLPSPVSTDSHWPHWVDPSYEYHAFVLGPDGFVWTYLKNVLVRIDPNNGTVHAVGRIDPVGWPTFVGRDLYLAGSEQLRRVRNIAHPPQTRSSSEQPNRTSLQPATLMTGDFFVSPHGQDRWSGRLANPVNGDGPFGTIARARDAVRQLLKSRRVPGPIRVVLRGGTYYLNQPLEFGPEDSGTEGAPVIYVAAPGEKVVLSGGRPLGNGHWDELNGMKIWTIDLPEVRDGGWRFRQLFVNGERRPRTRLPKQGEYQIESLPDVPTTDEAWERPVRRFVYAGTDIQRWHNLADVDVVAPVRWVDNRLPIQGVDPEKRIVTFDRSSVFNLVELYHAKPSTYWVENVFEALENPGQWYLDRPLGRLFYIPFKAEDPARVEAVAPRLTQLVRVVGRQDASVRFLEFEGLTFTHTEWQPPADWAASSQAAVDVPGALLLMHASECAIRQCRVEHVGTYAIDVGAGCRGIEISHNRLLDLGGGGVKIGHESQRTTVADNEIAHTGRLFMSAVGIWVGHSAGNQIVHNHIWDLHYSGISVGWQWNFKPSQAVSNVVEYNRIHDVGHGLLSDIGGIYTLGVSPGTRLGGNVIHDVKARAYGGWGIYPDEGSSEIVIESNLVYRCSSAPFFAHINQKITVQNNIFALGEQCQVERAGATSYPEQEYKFLRNLVYYRQGQLVGYWDVHHRNFACDQNLYWNASGAPVTFSGKSFAEWQAAGQDKASLIGDPLFVDPEYGDFALRPDSPAHRLGFQAWDLSTAGPRPVQTSRNQGQERKQPKPIRAEE